MNRLWSALRSLAALGLLLAWVSSFFIRCARHGLHYLVPQSEHWLITLSLTGGLALAAALLLWPSPGPVRRAIWTLLILIAAAEAWARYFPPGPPAAITLLPGETAYSSRLYRPHHYTLFEPLPDIHTPDGLIHNRLGLRDQRPLWPDPTAIRLVFIGGPTVYGAVTRDNREVFTQQLDDRLNAAYRQRLGNRHFEVINAGMADGTSAETLLRLIFAVSEVQPDLVAIQLGISDTAPRAASDDDFGDFRQMRKCYGHGRFCAPRASVADSLARTLIYRSALLNRGLGALIPAEPLLEMTNHNNTGTIERLQAHPPRFYERNLRYMLALIRVQGAEPMLVGDPIPIAKTPDGLYRRAVPEHNAVMARLGQTERIPFLDLGSALPLTDDIRLLDKYLNAAGQRRQAELLLDFLREQGLIDRLLARPSHAAG